jgi:hypothetical protein
MGEGCEIFGGEAGMTSVVNVRRRLLAQPNQHCCDAPSMSGAGLGCVKTKSDLVVMPSGGRIFAFLL